MLKENLVETFIVYFEQEKEQMTFCYTQMHLSLMDMFQVICDGQRVDNTDYPSLFEPVTYFVKDAQVGPGGNKATKNINPEATR